MSKIKKQAEGYALKVKSTNGYYLYQDIIKAVLKGVELANKWNGPDEKPEENTNEIILLMKDYDIYYFDIGYYDFVDNKFIAFNSEIIKLIGWQYLPEIKK